jgi:WD40 repeat protein
VGHIDGVNSVSFSPEGNRIVSGSEDKTLRLWNVKTGGAIGEPLIGHTGGIWSAAFSPGGTSIVSGSWDSTVRVWNVETAAAVGEQSKNFIM